VSSNFNLMLESVAFWEEDVDDQRQVDRTLAALLSPGARYAFNLPNEAQLVFGLQCRSALLPIRPIMASSSTAPSSTRLSGLNDKKAIFRRF